MAYDVTTAALEAAKKQDFVTDVQRDVSNLVAAFDRLKRVSKAWADRPQWLDGGSYPLANADTAHVNAAAIEVFNAIASINTLITSYDSQLVNFSPLLYPDATA